MSDEVRGTATKDEEVTPSAQLTKAGKRVPTAEEREKVERANALVREAYALLEEVFSGPMPVGRVQWFPIERVQANDYNPNSVAMQEMRLLHTSISEDGYTMPVVAVYDEKLDKAVIVDGYHRYTTMRKFADVHDSTAGYLPVSIIDKPVEDRIASTVRHNRARGKHSVAGMSNLVFQMLAEGETDESICNKLGLEAEELARLKHITGYSKLYASQQEYSKVMLNDAQIKAKAQYKKENPDEHVPNF